MKTPDSRVLISYLFAADIEGCEYIPARLDETNPIDLKNYVESGTNLDNTQIENENPEKVKIIFKVTLPLLLVLLISLQSHNLSSFHPFSSYSFQTSF